MGKKRSKTSESIGRKTLKAAKPNVFEQKYQKLKHKVIGKKSATMTRPIDSKSESFKRRTELLLPELRRFGKVNSLVDKRLGERNVTLSKEEKFAKRFAVERTKRLKKNLFKLSDDAGEDDILTHFGQKLSDDIIERMDKPAKEEEEDDGVLGADFVQQAHFGGGVEDSNEDETDRHRSRKDLIADMIARAKLARSERQTTREKTMDLTEQLDAKWKEMLSTKVFSQHLSWEKQSGNTQPVGETNDYDILVKELMFERKGVPSNRLKSDVELAKEEFEKLERFEQERQRRMNPSIKLDRPNHFNVDEDVGDSKPTRKGGKKSVRFQVAYGQSGQLMSDEAVSKEIESAKASLRQYKSATGAEGDEEIDDSEEDEESSSEEEDDSEEENDSAEEENSEDAEFHSAAEDSNAEDETSDQPKKGILRSKSTPITAVSGMSEIDAATLTLDIPYLMEMPDSYEKLVELLDGRSPTDQALVLERLPKNYHPGLKVGNKKRLKKLFLLLVRYMDAVAIDRPESFMQRIDVIVGILYQLASGFVAHASKVILAVITRSRQRFLLDKKLFPDWNCFCLLKLVAVLFPTSDYSHPVVSPAFQYGTEILASAKVRSAVDIAKGLLLCGILCDYVAQSKLFIPTVNGFLQAVMWSADPTEVDITRRPFPTFVTPSLLVPTSLATAAISPLSLNQIFGGTKLADEQSKEKLKLTCTSLAVHLYLSLAEIWKDFPSYDHIFKVALTTCGRIKKELYPDVLQKDFEDLSTKLQAKIGAVKLVPMKLESTRTVGAKPAKEFKFLEPRIEGNFNPEKSRRGGGKKGAAAEHQRLAHVYKRELKGTVRELKKDAQFIARAELMEEKTRDDRRKRKTSDLMKSLMGQEGEYKKMKRMKDKSKK